MNKDGESYNYGDKNDKVHRELDSDPPETLGHDLRQEVKEDWASPANDREYIWKEVDKENDGYSKKN